VIIYAKTTNGTILQTYMIGKYMLLQALAYGRIHLAK
jgi:hypothetical protein